MPLFSQKIQIRRLLLVATPLAALCTLLLPTIASAHAILSLSPDTNVLGGGNLSAQYSGQIDGPTLFNLLMITLVELGAVFWVGAQLWLNFVLQLSAEKHQEERSINEQVQARFERLFSLPTLLVLLLANIGVLVGQALNDTGGNWAQAFSPSLLQALATSGRYGAFWLLREGTIVLAIALSLFMLAWKRRPPLVDTVLPLLNLLLGLILFIAITMSSQAASVSANIVTYAIVVDWLHLLAAALWVGGIFYIAAIYLPVLKKHTLVDSARSLTTVLPYFLPLVIAGVLIMSVTGPFSATFQLTSWNQLTDTAYGRVLLVKILLVGGLLLSSAIHIGLLRPRLKKEYRKYTYLLNRQSAAEVLVGQGQAQPVPYTSTDAQDSAVESLSLNTKSKERWEPSRSPSGLGDEMASGTKQITQQVRLREKRLTDKTRRLTSVLRWEPLLGIAVLVCVGLMNVFGGTLTTPIPATQQQQPGAKPAPFTTTARTSDGKFNVTLNVNPNRFGTNVFTVSVVDNSTGKTVTNIGVTLYTTMLDMDMGTDSVNLLPDGKGHFSASGDLGMAGNWQIRIQIRTPDATLHETTVKLTTPF